MDLMSKNEAYKSYLEQGKEAFNNGDIKRAKALFLEAAKITNEITLESTSVKIKNQYYTITQTLLEFVRKNCSTEIKTATPNNNNSKETVKVVKALDEEVSLEEALEKLNSLIGLGAVKETISDWANHVEVFQIRQKMGLKVPVITYHMVFTGNPGTGKTTVAKIVGQISRALGIVSKGHSVVADRSKLVAGVVGDTAKFTNKVVDEAIGGVLFIDEAYTLAQGGENDFGREAIATLLLRMEDNRDDLVVIVAGYEDLMKEFIDSNPGLKSRFKTFIHFEDYKPEDMMKIFLLQCKQNDYVISDDLNDYLIKYFKEFYANRDQNFGNGRDVRNLFEKIVTNQSRRLSRMFAVKQPSVEEMMLLKLEDISR